jgi:hypothetical protein
MSIMIKKNKFDNKGQAIIMVVIMIGGLLFMATTVAGLLMFYQIQESTSFGESTQAIYGADAGLEKAVYYYYYKYDGSDNCYPKPCNVEYASMSLPNGTEVSAEMLIPPVDSREPIEITGKGESGKAIRLLQTVIR